MSEEEQIEEPIKVKQYEEIKTETEAENEDKDTKMTNDKIDEENNENLKAEKNLTRFKPKVKINTKKQRYPYCIVWTPIPCITWIFPSIGHAGICDSKGIIHDFAGPYYVSIDNMAFGNPKKYVLLDLNSEEFENYDGAIEGGTQDYNEKYYSLFFNNCHSYIARCLNKLKYKGKTNYTMIHVWWIFCIKGKFLSFAKFCETYLGFLIVVLIVLGFYFLFRF